MRNPNPNNPPTHVRVEPAADGWYIAVRVQPKGRADRIAGVHNGALKVVVTAPPEKGKANAAVCKLLAAALGVPASAVSVVSGETSRDKRVHVQLPDKWDAESLRAALLAGL